ncbi:hypothetical protein [Catalinimonas alkaloidigena]|uniref:hypothetical protein n=1 Tax=Catalinimonas alkaloidigena TaxID=1075417 RepID=UPI000B802D1C|nr:hypothetical protein [Catalinimonas alkaloidigena]
MPIQRLFLLALGTAFLFALLSRLSLGDAPADAWTWKKLLKIGLGLGFVGGSLWIYLAHRKT